MAVYSFDFEPDIHAATEQDPVHRPRIATETPSSSSTSTDRGIISLQDYPLVMGPAEAATVLGIGRNSIYSLLRSGQLKSIRIGRLIKIPRAALEEYLQQY